MKKIYVIHSSSYDFKNELYEPLRRITDFEFIFPHIKEGEVIDSKDLIKQSDIVLAEVSYSSAGSGIEMGRAESYGIPIVAIYQKNREYSSAISFVANSNIGYDNLDIDFEKIKIAINTL
jgi:nucleoside 2-deoxyribosyltransferase